MYHAGVYMYLAVLDDNSKDNLMEVGEGEKGRGREKERKGGGERGGEKGRGRERERRGGGERERGRESDACDNSLNAPCTCG